MIQRVWCVAVFLLLTAEEDTFWGKHWSTPCRYTSELINFPMPGVHIPVLDVLCFGLLVAAWSRPSSVRGRAAPMEKAIWCSIGTFLLWALIGIARGGSAFQARFQLHILIMVLVSGLMHIRVFTTPAHYRMLGKTIVYAGLFRFGEIFIFYITILRSLQEHLESVTSHADSMLFATCIVIVLANALHVRTRKAVLQAVLVTLPMLWSIQINNRRLAWVGLGGALIVMYGLFNIGPARKIINRYLIRALPLVAVYVVMGWSNPTGVFKPISALQSVNDPNNPSTQSRILENLGLIVTLQTNPLIGTGFGHEYIEISTTYSVGAAIFPEYRYDPHNSVLGLVAFTGALGFAGLWMVFPVTAFLGARGYAHANSPLVRTIALVSVCEVFIHINQLWGDLGALAPQGMVLIAAAMGGASRMSVLTGGFPDAKRAPANRVPGAGTGGGPPRPGGVGFSRAAP